MYIINNLMYGHDLSKNKELSDLIYEYDVDFRWTKNGVQYTVEMPYHGGQVAGDCPSIFFGAWIANDDGNKNYVKEVREAKEETYKADYQEFVQEFLIDMKSSLEEFLELEGSNGEAAKFIQEVEKFLSENEPEIYSVESSS